MVLGTLSQGDWAVLSIVIICTSMAAAYLFHEILGELGAGFALGSILLAAGAFGGIFLLDYLFLHSYVPRKYAVVQAWMIAATAGGSVLMFTAIALRQLARK
jgi:hypothetical protein